MKRKTPLFALLVLFPLVYSCSNHNYTKDLLQRIDDLQQQVDNYEQEKKQMNRHLEAFEELEPVSWNGNDQRKLEKLNNKQIKVYDADGAVYEGIGSQPKWFSGIPVTQQITIRSNPVKVAQKDWTAMISLVDFPVNDSTNFELPIATFARWEEGKIIEKHLFMDNMAVSRILESAAPVSQKTGK